MESEAPWVPREHRPPATGFSAHTYTHTHAQAHTHKAFAKKAEEKPYRSLLGRVLLDTTTL